MAWHIHPNMNRMTNAIHNRLGFSEYIKEGKIAANNINTNHVLFITIHIKVTIKDVIHRETHQHLGSYNKYNKP